MNEKVNELRSPIVASWILLFVTCLIAIIPFLGFFAWILGSVTILIALILGVVVIAKGGTWNGVFILLASLLVVPLFVFFAPIVTSLITGAALENYSEDSLDPIEMIEETPPTLDSRETEIELPEEEGSSVQSRQPEAGEAHDESAE